MRYLLLVQYNSWNCLVHLRGTKTIIMLGRSSRRLLDTSRAIAISMERSCSQSISDEVLFRSSGAARVITLNRPKALNALNLNMIRLMFPVLQGYANDREVKLIIQRGEGGKAFCAGGDVKAVVEAAVARRKGNKDITLAEDFFREEYWLNHLLGTIRKPIVSVIDGITMGGGVGLSVHGKFRLATEKTTFAMPETHIGLFPDVGGSWFLPRLEGYLGTFLALSGHRLTGTDVLHAGVATHYVESSKVSDVLTKLESLGDKTSTDSVEEILNGYNSQRPKKDFSLKPHLGSIDRHFAFNTVEGIVESLERDGSEWALKTLDSLRKASPTSLKVTLHMVRQGKRCSFEDCFRMEYRLTQRFVEEHDFPEGIRALLIDKDLKPMWKPDSLGGVTQEKLSWYFSRLPMDKEWSLPKPKH